MTHDLTQRRARITHWFWPIWGLLAVLTGALWLASHTGTNFLAHSAYDSYTLQALSWREGRIALSQNYPWLELAIYNEQYFVSFPPVPAVPMWLLSFVFGGNTPSALMGLLYLLMGYAALYGLARRRLPGAQAAGLAAFTALGGSLLDLAVSGGGMAGGVWYQAQLLAFALTALAFWGLSGERPAGWALGLIAIALAVGCRPLNAAYVPLLLYVLFTKIKRPRIWDRLLAMLPYIAIPALIALAYAAYNWARFGNPLEFGHSYLPEFVRDGVPMLSLSRVFQNIALIFRPITLDAGRLTFPIISGFAVYLTNPLLWMAPLRLIRRRLSALDAALAISLLVHIALLLTHRTNGGWQYGTRYLCDALPAAVWLFARDKRPIGWLGAALMGALVVVNALGVLGFHG
ncbi:MAG: hypothetical protein LBN04_10900 [Oscillospiraceae bacterium]|jgi:hypothetical protein|nr:hypothetical protein [Oscillospiraceae bacterium]